MCFQKTSGCAAEWDTMFELINFSYSPRNPCGSGYKVNGTYTCFFLVCDSEITAASLGLSYDLCSMLAGDNKFYASLQTSSRNESNAPFVCDLTESHAATMNDIYGCALSSETNWVQTNENDDEKIKCGAFNAVLSSRLHKEGLSNGTYGWYLKNASSAQQLWILEEFRNYNVLISIYFHLFFFFFLCVLLEHFDFGLCFQIIFLEFKKKKKKKVLCCGMASVSIAMVTDTNNTVSPVLSTATSKISSMTTRSPTLKPTLDVLSLGGFTGMIAKKKKRKMELVGTFDSRYSVTNLEDNVNIETLTNIIKSILTNQQIQIIEIYWNNDYDINNTKIQPRPYQVLFHLFIYIFKIKCTYLFKLEICNVYIGMVWLVNVADEYNEEKAISYASSTEFIQELNDQLNQQNLSTDLFATQTSATLCYAQKVLLIKFWRGVAKWFDNHFMYALVVVCVLSVCSVCCITYAFRCRRNPKRFSSLSVKAIAKASEKAKAKAKAQAKAKIISSRKKSKKSYTREENEEYMEESLSNEMEDEIVVEKNGNSNAGQVPLTSFINNKRESNSTSAVIAPSWRAFEEDKSPVYGNGSIFDEIRNSNKRRKSQTMLLEPENKDKEQGKEKGKDNPNENDNEKAKARESDPTRNQYQEQGKKNDGDSSQNEQAWANFGAAAAITPPQHGNTIPVGSQTPKESMPYYTANTFMSFSSKEGTLCMFFDLCIMPEIWDIFSSDKLVGPSNDHGENKKNEHRPFSLFGKKKHVNLNSNSNLEVEEVELQPEDNGAGQDRGRSWLLQSFDTTSSLNTELGRSNEELIDHAE
ncbi:hypothetical protein RFI_12315 [Reticulomyxa filosa]|uniref:Uncharacterized protein n=1 Tax=Reticulomyxa filosa TaxID=46433 RepID=X6NG20_RETFI|nr:hypothetical protein RFI_12315 [Reticulomyxa filosa]|eukprot:ETO24843.1 hypothetical protein RFI_12315 [Reticulomyxa filosa]